MSKAIGGYFGLELRQHNNNNNPHSKAYAVNSGRNALHCILESLQPTKVLIPRLLCEVILEPLKKQNILYDFYSINEFFQPNIKTLESGTFLLYINYFGVCDSICEDLANRYPSQIIIDNTQAFFTEPIPEIPTFYSIRKFFGVPDGAYFYGVDFDLSTLSQDTSWDRCTHLLKRIDLSPEDGYQDFCENDQYFSTLQPARISKLTTTILNSVDFLAVKQTRMGNYKHLHTALQKTNLLNNFLPDSSAGISYPYLVDNGLLLRSNLIDKNIFIPRFWPRAEMFTNSDSNEKQFAEEILHLPIDQRINCNIINSVLNFILSKDY